MIAGACIAAAVVAVPVLTEGSQPAGPPPVAATGELPSEQAVDGSRYVVDRPTRGSLADDREFVDKVRTLPWSDGEPEVFPDGSVMVPIPEPPAEQRHVMFAGNVPGGRWAVVVGPSETGLDMRDGSGSAELMAMVFRGPADATAEQLTPDVSPNWVPADWTAVVLDPATGTLLVLPAPGDRVELSERPEIAADGSSAREYRLLETTDGVSLTSMRATGAYNWAAVYRLIRDGRPQSALHPWPLSSPEVAMPQIAVDFPRGTPSPTGATAAGWAAERILGEIGLRPSEVEVTAQWVGTVPVQGPGEVAVVTVTLPSGAIVVDAQWMSPARDDGSSTGGVCGRTVLRAGPPAAERVYAMTCEVFDDPSGAPPTTNLVVVAPPEVAAVRAYGDRSFLSEHPATDGVLVVPLRRGTDSVEAVTATGVSLGRVDLLGYAEGFSN